MNLHNIWPRSLAQLTSEDVKSLTEKDFFELCRLVRQRARKYCSNDQHPKTLVRRLKRLRIHPIITPNIVDATYKENNILTAFVPNRDRKWTA
ncbi:MAG: hypothetical protein OXC17_06495, partial [Aestuariivita sp.]|nr:hypothetical protein [Aestuariivita sp.]